MKFKKWFQNIVHKFKNVHRLKIVHEFKNVH
jgi:hypothetical protein